MLTGVPVIDEHVDDVEFNPVFSKIKSSVLDEWFVLG
jgi:hypothetical protein